jgi:hypothetical protein
MALDVNEGVREASADPFDNLVAANAHATDPLTNGDCRGIFVTVSGNLTCRFVDGAGDVTLPVTADKIYPFRLSHIRATSTATVFVGY